MINEGEKTFVLRQITYAREWLDRALGHYEKSNDTQGFMDLTIAEAEIRSAREKSAELKAAAPKPSFARYKVRIAQVSAASIIMVGFVAGIIYSQARNVRPGAGREPETTIISEATKPGRESAAPVSSITTALVPAPNPIETASITSEPDVSTGPAIAVPVESVPHPIVQPAVRPRLSIHASAGSIHVPKPVVSNQSAPAPAVAVKPDVNPLTVEVPVPAVEPVPAVTTERSRDASIISLEEYSALKRAALEARDKIK